MRSCFEKQRPPPLVPSFGRFAGRGVSSRQEVKSVYAKLPEEVIYNLLRPPSQDLRHDTTPVEPRGMDVWI